MELQLRPRFVTKRTMDSPHAAMVLTHRNGQFLVSHVISRTT